MLVHDLNTNDSFQNNIEFVALLALINHIFHPLHSLKFHPLRYLHHISLRDLRSFLKKLHPTELLDQLVQVFIISPVLRQLQGLLDLPDSAPVLEVLRVILLYH